jgi:serine/threonine protein kinase/formylglycine-generating enzyme required for sulfatase activity
MTPEPPDSGTWAPPQEFDEYQLIRLLGQGSMGRVYLAHDTVLDRAVAIKFMSSVADAEDRERFFVEARAVARLQHPNVVTVHRVGELAGYPFLITEYIRGKSLSELALPVQWRKVLELGVGLARGLAAAHRHGVLHRDIKLANALLSESGEVKLLDFGLAKLIDPTAADSAQQRQLAPDEARDAAASAVHRHSTELARRSGSNLPVDADAEPDPEPARTSSQRMSAAAILSTSMSATLSAVPFGAERPDDLTQSGTLLGTPNYMAPELWRAEPATRRSDVYALGVLLYILASGWPPTEASSIVDLATRVQEQEPRGLLEREPRCDVRLAAVVDRCLRRDPFERYASGEDLLAALEALSPLSRELTIPDGNPYRGLQAFESKHRALFFGRSVEIRAVLERLRADALVVVAGDSGVGKSSLCKAGVAPLVEEGHLDANRQWTSINMTPGRYPLPTLISAMANLFGVTDETMSARVHGGADDLVRALRKQLGDGQGRLLVIDQFEELATLAAPEEAAIVGPLLARLASGLPGLRVLATVRGDFLTRVAQVPGIGDELSRAIYILRPLSPEGAREAIVGPARVKGVGFESDELVEGLVRAGSRGSLPLLQFALAELWAIRDPKSPVISAAELAKIGGVTGALARHGDAALAELIPEQRLAARRVLMRLVTVDDTRAVRTEEELVAGSASAEAALKALVRSRLVVAREVADQSVFEIAHEALLGGWATLSSWLDEERESRAVRHRLELAVTDWERLGRGSEGVWSGAPLQELLALDPSTLRPRERDFIAACRTAVARTRLLRRAAALALPVVALLTYGGLWLKGQVDLRSRVDAHAATAKEEQATAEARAGEAERLRTESFAAFDAGQTDKGDELWGRHIAAVADIERGLARAAQQFEMALSLDAGRDDVRKPLLDTLWQRAILAEQAGRDELMVQDQIERIKLYDHTGEHMARWNAPAQLQVTSDPPGAKLTLRRYRQENGRLRIDLAEELGTTPLPARTLERGSYILHFELPGKVLVGYPVALGRGESFTVTVTLPPADAVPNGFIYVPPGRFLYGSRDIESVRTFLRAEPMHLVETGAYLIARDEVTYDGYLEFLAAQSPTDRATLLAASASGPMQLELRPEGNWRLTLTFPTNSHTVDSGVPIVYPGRTQRASVAWERLPLTGITDLEANAYMAWLDRTGKVPGARYCNEYEWERAARGADGRLFVSGDEFHPEDGNFDETYGKVPTAMGPDAVGSYPQNASPLGLHDTDGNAYELTVGTTDKTLMVRGGAYFYSKIQARTTARFEFPAGYRDPTLGLRVCATWPPHTD